MIYKKTETRYVGVSAEIWEEGYSQALSDMISALIADAKISVPLAEQLVALLGTDECAAECEALNDTK